MRRRIHFVAIERALVNDCSLPKGHQDKGESLQQTAIREILEETGFKTVPLAYLGKFTYQVTDEGKKKIILRTVHWFLMKYKSGKPRKRNKEIKRVRLELIDSNLDFLTYENDRRIVKKAKNKLRSYPNWF